MPRTAPADHSDLGEYVSRGYLMTTLAGPAEVAAILADAEALQRQAAQLTRSHGDFNLEAPAGGYIGQAGHDGEGGEGYVGVLRKLGNAHTHSARVLALSRQPAVTGLADALLGTESELVHSIIWYKPPRVGSPKPPHQDAPYLDGDPDTYVTLWIALDPCTPENGCLVVVPGSHHAGPIEHKGTEKQIPADAFRSAGPTPVPLAAGDAIAFHPCLLHASAANTSDRPRRALMLRYRTRRADRG